MLDKRKITWAFLFAFLLGCVFAELTSDILSDALFFRRVSTGVPLTAEESILYWYYLPAFVYFCLLIVVVVLWKHRAFKPKYFAYLLVALAAFGAYRTVQVFPSLSTFDLLLLTVPVLMLSYVLLIKHREVEE